MNTAALFDIAADVGSDEDEDFDENAPRKPKKTNGEMDDSSEEEDDDDDEEARQEVAEGFIVDGDEDEEDDVSVKHKKRKRRRERDEEEGLDEEDLDLIGETYPEEQNRAPKPSKFKRLKQGHREERSQTEHRDIADIFSDEEDEDIDVGRPAFRERVDEFADFIEEDDLPDEERERMLEEQEVARPGRQPYSGFNGIDTSGLDESTQEDYNAAFGDGYDYMWALDLQEQADLIAADPNKQLELKDVFEPSQLAERMLTEEDDIIRRTDVPERFQIARKSFKAVDRDEDETKMLLQEEAQWIGSMMLPRKKFDSSVHEHFNTSIRKMLEYINLDDLEIPFIFQHRKDYLIYEERVPRSPSADNPDGEGFTMNAIKMINQDDMWDILDFDLKWKGLVDKRENLQSTYTSLRASDPNISDSMLEELIGIAVTMEEVQDLQDYFFFKYSDGLKDVVTEGDRNGKQKQARAARNFWAKQRKTPAYELVKAFGISADAFAQNAIATGARQYTEDPIDRPDDMADMHTSPEYPTGAQVLRAAKGMYAEELLMCPRLRRYLRETFYAGAKIDCWRTEKGARQITEDHRYFEFKYLRNQELHAMARKPELYLRMLQAEVEGLVEVKITLVNRKNFRERLYTYIESDNVSDVAGAWNTLRREVLDMAIDRLEKVISKGVKEALKAECEGEVGKRVRNAYVEKLDQAPHKVKNLAAGTAPRVLALSNGNGVLNRDAICWVYLEDDGRVLENGKFIDLRPGNAEKYQSDGKDIKNLVELVKRRRPDVIAVSGFAPETRKLYKDLQDIVEKNQLMLPDFDEDEDQHDDEDNKLEVIMVNDEVARLYHTSQRAVSEFPTYAPIARYTIGLARYVQNPMLEYAALGKNIISISFDPSQDLLSEEKLLKWLDTAMVDMVNLVGVNINEAVGSAYHANLLPYVCGLGPRKAQQLLSIITRNGGHVETRAELVGDEEKGKLPAMGFKVWENCASFIDIVYDDEEAEADYLDHTRIHPEDYDTARKMAADAMELDEEDVKMETDENGPSGVVRKLVKEDAADKVNDLVLEEYAEQLLKIFNQRKRATLETIRAELISPYEELRRSMKPLNSEEAFTMMTGETEESLVEGMIVPVTIRRVFMDHIECKLDSGLEGGIGAEHYPESISNGGMDPRQVYQPNQVVQAIVQFLNKRSLTCQLSLRDDLLRKPYKKKHIVTPGEWDEDQEEDDKRALLKEKEAVSGRAQRVIKHPLFHPFNSAQAEEYLGSHNRGDVVIRPSSKGTDHLAVTWKVADNVYQHIDVLELDKDNEFALGRTLTIGGKYKYSDLDELIVLHVKAMAKKVDEMMSDERYQNGSKGQTEQWLTTYTEANPKRSMYAFCINPKYPGYFFICFKAGQNAPLSAWPVKVVPDAFEMRKLQYPDMKTLKNGFKLLFQSMSNGGGGQQQQQVRR
ncbi:Pentafunctional AROM polypeptide [Venturia inaequalis]|nr:Pentafunctional AROM polypeptide [Venturia inaequalis]